MNADMAIASTHVLQCRILPCSDSDHTSVSAKQRWQLTGQMEEPHLTPGTLHILGPTVHMDGPLGLSLCQGVIDLWGW